MNDDDLEAQALAFEIKELAGEMREWERFLTLVDRLAAMAQPQRAREALELIAAPQRPDGSWNRDREACRRLAAEVLGLEA